ncbi:M28 family peptidase [Brevibacillus marinus]|uniref:M28 family peptidase n=1 Tax=Brevibacillus marinus TaxID=2496837 RepID=UPI000F833656|nr:M28 family peptidase [Brevibacillus marinus]
MRIQRALTVLWVGLLLLSGTLLGLWQNAPPDEQDLLEAVGSSSFLSNILKHLDRIAESPHPTGWPGNDRVRRYLTEQIQAAGLVPVVQTETIVSTDKGRTTFVSAAEVHNVMARVPGKAPTKALLLMAHYDSESYSPGAGDDGVAVAVLLETMRYIAQGNRLNNDVIFLFTDGEELGLYGARGFWNRHPWSRDVGLVLNFEAKGTTGPSILFQTSEQNGWLISRLGGMTDAIIGHSLADEVYRFLSNDTDLTVPLEKGIAGLNFAFGGSPTHYHTPLDSREHVDVRSVVHHALYAYQLTLGFGNVDLADTKAADRIYFPLFGKILHYPQKMAYVLTGIVIALTAALLWLGLKKRLLTLRGILIALLTLYGIGVLITAVACGLWSLLRTGIAKMTLADAVYHAGYYHMLFLGLSGSIALLVWGYVRTKLSIREQFFGVLTGWVLVLLGLTVVLPGGTYLLTWPLLIQLCGPGAALLAANSPNGVLRNPWLNLLNAWPPLVLIVPVLQLVLVFTPLDSSVWLMGVTGMALLLLIPCWESSGAYRKQWFALTFVSLALVAAILLAADNDYSESFPQGDNLFYVYQADRNEAFWVSKFAPAGWIRSYIHAAQPTVLENLVPNRGNPQKAWIAQAPVRPLTAPSVRLLGDRRQAGIRTLSLFVTKGDPATRMLMLQVDDAHVLDCRINGLRPSVKEGSEAVGKWMLRFVGRMEQGIVVELRLEAAKRVTIRAVGAVEGLPPHPAGSKIKRPKDRMPLYEYDGLSMAVKAYRF